MLCAASATFARQLSEAVEALSYVLLSSKAAHLPQDRERAPCVISVVVDVGETNNTYVPYYDYRAPCGYLFIWVEFAQYQNLDRV